MTPEATRAAHDSLDVADPARSTKESIYLTSAGIFSILGVLIFLGSAAWTLTRSEEELAGGGGDTARETISRRLKQLGAALDAYHKDFGAFPPAVVADENGKPQHSWRLLLLPYLDQADLYKQYKLDEPWDGPHNSQLASQMPEVFASPLIAEDLRQRQTAFLAVVGETTAWRGADSVKREDITDLPDRTILLVEASRQPVNWLAPQDLEISRMGYSLRAEKDQLLFADESEEAQVLMADHKVEKFTGRTPKATFRELLEINDGKPEPAAEENAEEKQEPAEEAAATGPDAEKGPDGTEPQKPAEEEPPAPPKGDPAGAGTPP